MIFAFLVYSLLTSSISFNTRTFTHLYTGPEISLQLYLV